MNEVSLCRLSWGSSMGELSIAAATARQRGGSDIPVCQHRFALPGRARPVSPAIFRDRPLLRTGLP
jgi:hypothetical protein